MSCLLVFVFTFDIIMRCSFVPSVRPVDFPSLPVDSFQGPSIPFQGRGEGNTSDLFSCRQFFPVLFLSPVFPCLFYSPPFLVSCLSLIIQKKESKTSSRSTHTLLDVLKSCG